MANSAAIKSKATGSFPVSSKLKILLLILAFAIIGTTLWYTSGLVHELNQKEKDVAGLYAESLEYIVNAKTSEGDFNFVFSNIIKAIDFPIVMTDKNNEPIQPYQNNVRNLSFDTTLAQESQHAYLLGIIAGMDQTHPPIKVAYQDTIVLSYVHFGESDVVTRLRWLPYIEMAIAALFILIGYISFSYIKRSEQSSIWVGMSRETAHQLGTPISSMLGWLELLKEQSTDQGKEIVSDMGHDLNRLQKITDRFSKIGSRPDLHEEDLNEVLTTVIQYFERRLPKSNPTEKNTKRIQLLMNAGRHISAPINRELFEWVIENLTRNAIDAIETGSGTIAYTLTEAGRHAYVDISDTGKGIDAKHRRDVFRPGFSTKKRGWGLGLSLAKRIIETYHHGKLFLKDSEEGYKTTFRIKLKR